MEPTANPTYYPPVSQPSAPVISVKDWMITLLLAAIPVVNIIMLLVWAFGGGANPSKANYAKAALIWVLIGIVIFVFIFVLMIGLIGVTLKDTV